MNISLNGLLSIVVAVMFFSVMNVSVKSIPHIPVIEIVFFRSLITFIISILGILKAGVSIFGNNKKVLIMRGSFGIVSLSLFFYTLQVMPLATALTVHYITPIFTAIISFFFLKERLKAVQTLFFLVSFIGIVILKGFDLRVAPLDVAIGILGAVFAGAAYSCIRSVKESEHPLVIILYFPLVALPVSGVLTINEWVTPSLKDLLFLGLVGIFTQLGQWFMTRAYQQEKASLVASVSNVGIFFGLFYGYFLFDETYEFTALIGMFLVTFGILLNVWFENRVKNSLQ